MRQPTQRHATDICDLHTDLHEIIIRFGYTTQIDTSGIDRAVSLRPWQWRCTFLPRVLGHVTGDGSAGNCKLMAHAGKFAKQVCSGMQIISCPWWRATGRLFHPPA